MKIVRTIVFFTGILVFCSIVSASDEKACDILALRAFAERLTGSTKEEYEILLSSLDEGKKVLVESDHPMGSYKWVGIVENIQTAYNEDERPRAQILVTLKTKEGQREFSLTANGPGSVKFWDAALSKPSPQKLEQLRGFSERLAGSTKEEYDILVSSWTDGREVVVAWDDPRDSYKWTGVVEGIETNYDENERPRAQILVTLKTKEGRREFSLTANGPDSVEFK